MKRWNCKKLAAIGLSVGLTVSQSIIPISAYAQETNSGQEAADNIQVEKTENQGKDQTGIAGDKQVDQKQKEIGDEKKSQENVGFRVLALDSAAVDAPQQAQAGDFTVTGDAASYSYTNNILTIKDGATLTIKNTNTSASTTNQISVANNAQVNLTLSGVNIDVSKKDLTCALKVGDGATCNLTLANGSTNTLKSGAKKAGLQAQTTAKLNIDGNGKLFAYGGAFSAGIGGSSDTNAPGGTITFNGGDVKAYGGNGNTGSEGSGGAGVGGGGHGAGGNITVNAGTVNGTGGSTKDGSRVGIGGAGIGGAGGNGLGYGGEAGTIIINGGTAVGTGGGAQTGQADSGGGAGIGSGGYSTLGRGIITIKGGNVLGIGGWNAAGIGGGDRNGGGTITIEGGDVKGVGMDHGAGIGGGDAGSGGTIIIKKGSVNAIGGNSSAGIGGGGHQGPGGNITISGGTVKAAGGAAGAGIGGGNKGAGGVIAIEGGTVDATGGGNGGAGIGGGAYAGTPTSITIKDGTVTATGGGGGAGIGGGGASSSGYGGAGGSISIEGGTVNAKGGAGGAGIGGGQKGAGGTTSIKGGVVKATGSGNGAGIGGGQSGGKGTFSSNNGQGFITASSIADQDNKNDWGGVIFEGTNDGKVYGSSVTLNVNTEIPPGKTLIVGSDQTLIVKDGATLTVKNGATLTVKDGATLTNQGKIVMNQGGSLTTDGSGQFEDNGTVQKAEQKPESVTVSPTTVKIGGAAPIITPLTVFDNAAVTYSAVTTASDSSEASDVASISGQAITLKMPGTFYVKAEIAATHGYNGKTVYSQKITVKPKAPVTDVVVDKTVLTLQIGGTASLSATVLIGEDTNQEVTWSSSNSDVATVDTSGKVTAIGSGSAEISAEAGGKTGTCTLIVIPTSGGDSSGGGSSSAGLQ